MSVINRLKLIWDRSARMSPLMWSKFRVRNAAMATFDALGVRKDSFGAAAAIKNGCKATYQDARGKPSLTPNKQAAASSAVISDEFQCPDCGAGLIRRKSTKKPNAYWWGCSGFPKCKNTWLDQNAQPLGLSS